jgi:hypothetical protein
MPNIEDFDRVGNIVKGLNHEIGEEQEALSRASKKIKEEIAPLLGEFVNVYNGGPSGFTLEEGLDANGKAFVRFKDRSDGDEEYTGPSFFVRPTRRTPVREDQVTATWSSEWIQTGSEPTEKNGSEPIKTQDISMRVLELCRDWAKASTLRWFDHMAAQ